MTNEYKIVVPILCSECWHITTFDLHEDEVRGSTYDCECGRVMRITRDLSTVDLHREMTDAIGSNVDSSKFGYVELA
jgi:hypothetical protein